MTARERLVAASRGGETDRKADFSVDAVVVPDADSVMADEERAVLVEVLSPYGQAISRGEDPQVAVIEELVETSRGAMRDALDAGADGILYRLHGARGEAYARYRPHDRALLEEIGDARLNVLFAVPPFDLELVRDLPAHVFAWPGETPDATTVRARRNGAQASSDPLSEIRLAA